MSWTLSITGKGGVGKTTFSALAIRWLSENRTGSILAVDADPNSCLDSLLGVQCEVTVGGVREETKQISQTLSAGGMGKQEILDLKIQEALVETDRFDLIAMGRPEGPGCYCYANNVLRGTLSRLSSNYPYIVIDNEAGLENLSRRTVQESTWLVFLSDSSARGIRTARRLFDLAQEMGVKSQRYGVVINRLIEGLDLEQVRSLFQDTPVEFLGCIPDDPQMAELDAEGKPVSDLPQCNPVYQSVANILQSICSK